jgi:hypothetical protein
LEVEIQRKFKTRGGRRREETGGERGEGRGQVPFFFFYYV